MQVDYKCCSCDKVFGQQSALTGHIVEQHARPGINVCDLCGKTFSHPSSVIYHKEVRPVPINTELGTCRSRNREL